MSSHSFIKFASYFGQQVEKQLSNIFCRFKYFLVDMMVNPGPSPLVLCGPSGAGKSTLLKKMLDQYKNQFGFSVSHTTR